VADFQLRVTAETQKAEKDLQRLDKTANEATKGRRLSIDVTELSKNFKNVEKNVKEAGNTIQTFYRISKNIPGIGDRVKEFESLAKGTAELAKNAPASAAALRENAKASSILSGSLETAGNAAGRLVNSLAKAGLALFAVKEAVGVLQAAFGGFFNETIGREIKLRETILKTQTTLASTNKVFRNGTEITDPYQKIVALTGEVAKRIDSIRERSIALAGVTSNDVIEVFGIVASQVGQIGGGLKEAEDLAINFSAALGTFGIPLYQARQEIGSILRGDITTDSYLAKALGITNEDVTKAKSQAGGVVKFLEERLAAAVAGQRIAAQGFAGVVSNIQDLSELVSQRFGAGLLDPLLGGLTKIFDFLFKIREEVFAISEGMGRGLGQLLSTNLTAITGGSALFGQLGAGAEGFAASLAKSVQGAFASLQANANQVIAPIRNLLEELTKSFGLVAAGLTRLAQGFISIKIENFKALIQIFSNLSEAVTAFSAVLGQVLRAYGQLLQVPFVQYLSQISAQFQILEKLGVMSAVKLGIAAVGLIAAWQPIVTFFQALVARIAALIGGLVIAVGAAFTRIGAIVASFAATLTATYPAAEALRQQLLGLAASLTAAGAAADKAGASVTRFGGATTAAARTASTAILNFIKFNAILLAIQLGITVLIDLFGRFQRAQEETARSARAAEALRRLQTTYKDVGDAASSATKAARDFEQALVDADYAKNLDALEKVREKINQIRYELKPGIQSWREFWDALSGSEVGRFEERSRQVLQGLIRDEKNLKDKLGAVDKERDKRSVEEKITLEADKRISLEKEISDLRKQQEDALFQQRQTLAQKEVEIFRAAGELRIFQMELANAKLIEGEEGASAAALDSLNTYLSTRERGELDIEAAKKSLVIEVANLEREISNYRLENEKKIAEIRKRAGDYEQKVANYRRQVAGQIAAGTGGGAATFGSTGNVNNAAGWVHGHFQTNTGTLSDLVSDVIPVLKALLDQGIPVELSNGTRIAAGKDDAYYRRMLGNAASQHTHSGDGRSLDLFVPEGTKVPVPLSDITGNTGRGGITGGLPGSGKSWVGHLAPGSKAGGSAALPPPTAPSFVDVATPAADRYAAAVRGVASALERARALQAALTNARTAAAFDAIAKAAFPKVALEEYDNQAIELQGTLDALRGISAELYDPEQIKIAVEQKSKELIADRERKQILESAQQQLKKNNITQAEFSKLTADLAARQKKFNEDLAAEGEKRRRNLELAKQQNAVESLKKATGAIRFDVARAGVQAQATMAQAFAGDNSTAQRLIEAEQRIAEERIRLEQDGTKTTADITRELTAFAEKTRAAATELGRMDEEVKAFVAQMTAIRDVSNTLTDGYKGMFQSVLSGGDVKEAVGQMTKTITDRLVGIALDAAFKPLEDYFVQTLKDLFGIEDPTVALQEQNNTYLDLNTKAIEANTLALQGKASGPIALPVTPFSGQTADSLQAMLDDPTQGIAAVEKTLEQSFAGIGETLTHLGTTAAETAQGANTAATEGEKGFSKFLGGMMGVATGALSIAGGIQQLQEGGTSNTLAGIGSILLGIGGAIGGLGSMGLFGKKAGGGAISANRPYLVGEVGPEIVVPRSSGTVMSNNQLREAMSTSAGGTSAPQLNMTFQTTNIGGVEYVSREQLEAAMASTRRAAVRDGARQGMSMTIDKLRQSPGTRGRVGLS
jgi:hypothetical protein